MAPKKMVEAPEGTKKPEKKELKFTLNHSSIARVLTVGSICKVWFFENITPNFCCVSPSFFIIAFHMKALKPENISCARCGAHLFVGKPVWVSRTRPQSSCLSRP